MRTSEAYKCTDDDISREAKLLTCSMHYIAHPSYHAQASMTNDDDDDDSYQLLQRE